MSKISKIFIDGQEHMIVGGLTISDKWTQWQRFKVDSPEHPGIPCAEHSLPCTSLYHIFIRGGAVRSNGHRYTASEDV